MGRDSSPRPTGEGPRGPSPARLERCADRVGQNGLAVAVLAGVAVGPGLSDDRASHDDLVALVQLLAGLASQGLERLDGVPGGVGVGPLP